MAMSLTEVFDGNLSSPAPLPPYSGHEIASALLDAARSVAM
jgi:hypothetical protein